MNSLLKSTLFVFMFAVLLLGTLSYYSHQTSVSDFNYGEKIWRHRGGNPNNTIEGLISSHQNGFRGFEVDVHFEDNFFFLKHDWNQKPDPSQTLEKVFQVSRISQDSLLWLDLKNLTLFNVFQVKRRLDKKFHSQKSRLLIESKSMSATIILTAYGFQTALWLTPSSNEIYRVLKKTWYSIGIKWFNQKRISFDQSIGLKKVGVDCQDCHILVFTENDPQKIQHWKSLSNVKVILTDNDK